ncbi:MAG: hypothetical protein ACK4NY_17455 [Spirosomataceae bacterium]
MNPIIKFISYNISWVLVVPILVILFRHKHLKKELKIAAIFVGMGIFFEILSRIIAYIYKTNLPMLHLYTILEFCLIAWFYHNFFDGFFNQKTVPILILSFVGFAIINITFIQSLFEFNTYPRGLESLLITGLAILAFYKMLQELEYTRLDKSPIFWINSGFLIYFAGSLFLFLMGNLLLSKDRQLSLIAWTIHAFLFGFMQIFIAVGLWHSPRR